MTSVDRRKRARESEELSHFEKNILVLEKGSHSKKVPSFAHESMLKKGIKII
jgi:hypothetical protein